MGPLCGESTFLLCFFDFFRRSFTHTCLVQLCLHALEIWRRLRHTMHVAYAKDTSLNREGFATSTHLSVSAKEVRRRSICCVFLLSFVKRTVGVDFNRSPVEKVGIFWKLCYRTRIWDVCYQFICRGMRFIRFVARKSDFLPLKIC